MSKFWHGVLHVGAGAVQVAAATGYFIPFPFNVAVIGGVSIVQGIVALRHHKTSD